MDVEDVRESPLKKYPICGYNIAHDAHYHTPLKKSQIPIPEKFLKLLRISAKSPDMITQDTEDTEIQVSDTRHSNPRNRTHYTDTHK